jgi:hypothetical protein
MKRLLTAALLCLLFVFPALAGSIRTPKGFEKKVYSATYALYATSEHRERPTPKFLCTVTAFQKFQEGYLFLGAGHCTTANPQLPDDLKFFIASDIDYGPRPIELIKVGFVDIFIEENAKKHLQLLDYAVFYLKTTEPIPTISLGDEGSLKIGSKTLNVNFSEGQAKYVSPGIVNTTVVVTGDMLGFFGVQEFATHGASGSSVVDLKTKKIVGLLIAGNEGVILPAWVEPISTVEKDLKGADFGKLIEHPEIPKAQRPQDDDEDPI